MSCIPSAEAVVAVVVKFGSSWGDETTLASHRKIYGSQDAT